MQISRMLRLVFGFLLISVFGLPLITQAERSPNIVLILADDLGFSDLGSYGSEIATPNLDRLAYEGLRFSSYHTAASCAPTRAMLVTGHDSHLVGVPNIPEAIPGSQIREPNYQGVLSKDFETIAEMLERKSYRNYFAGKWHLGMDEERLPFARGFHRSLSMADTGSDNWEQKPYLPIYGSANWFEDGERIRLPEDYYSSSYIVDKTIQYLDEGPQGNPFFAFVSFMAVHIPVQAPAEYRDRYKQMYFDGWEALAEERSKGLAKMNILEGEFPVNLAPTAVSWVDLNASDRNYFTKAMQVYAGMVESMDFEVGRLIDYLDQVGKLDNTVFLFLSDNGAEGSIAVDPTVPFVPKLLFSSWLKTNGYHDDIERLGEKGSFVNIGPSWASASVGPLSWFKFHSSEGGMRVPLVISGSVDGKPLVSKPGRVFHEFVWATDIAPTILDMAGSKEFQNLPGKTLVPVLNGSSNKIRGNDEVVGYELGGNKALFMGPYKLVYNRTDDQLDRWMLFNLVKDPAEQYDLSEEQPDVFDRMRAEYESWEKKNGVLAVPEGYNQERQVMLNGMKNRPVLWIVPLAIILFALGAAFLLLRASFLRRD